LRLFAAIPAVSLAMKVFLTGASGFVGREILIRLCETGHSVRLLARHPEAPQVRTFVRLFRVEVHRGDVVEAGSLKGALTGVDAIIHLVGIISESGRNTYENIHTRGAGNLVAEAKIAGVVRFIHMSALGTRANAISRYHKSKWAAEELVRASRLDWTIFRPSIIYGPGDKFVNLFARMARFSPFIPVMGDGQSRMQPIPVEDVAASFVGALTDPASIQQTYDLCGPRALTFNDLLKTILEVTRRKRALIHIPVKWARIQARFLELLFAMIRRPPPLNRDQILMLEEDNIGDPGPATVRFNLSGTEFRDGIHRYLE